MLYISDMAVDILIIVAIAAGLVIGFVRGAIGQIALIVGVVAGIVAARLFGDNIARFFAGGDAMSGLEATAGYAVAFIAAYLLAWIVVKVFRKTVHAVHLGILDRIAGALVKGFIWTLALSLVFNIYLLIKGNQHELDHPKKPWRAMVVRLAPATLGFLNHELGNKPSHE